MRAASLPGAHGAIPGCFVPIGYHKNAAVREAAERLYARCSQPRESMCSWTIATSAPACCSPTWSSSAFRTAWSSPSAASLPATPNTRAGATTSRSDVPLGAVVDFLKQRAGVRSSSSPAPRLAARTLGGAQIYEPLADSVRQRLSHMVADRAPASMHFREPGDGQRWLDEMDRRLERRIPDRQQRLELLRTVQYEATRAGSTPSSCSASSRSRALSQVRRLARRRARLHAGDAVLGEAHRAADHNLFHLRTKHRLRLRHPAPLSRPREGDYYRALGRYNGSLGRSGVSQPRCSPPGADAGNTKARRP